MLQYDNSPGPGRETHHSLQLQTQWRGDETPLIMIDRHQDHSALPYRPAPPISFSKTGPVAILDSCFSLPSWAPDGVWALVQLHWLLLSGCGYYKKEINRNVHFNHYAILLIHINRLTYIRQCKIKLCSENSKRDE